MKNKFKEIPVVEYSKGIKTKAEGTVEELVYLVTNPDKRQSCTKRTKIPRTKDKLTTKRCYMIVDENGVCLSRFYNCLTEKKEVDIEARRLAKEYGEVFIHYAYQICAERSLYATVEYKEPKNPETVELVFLDNSK